MQMAMGKYMTGRMGMDIVAAIDLETTGLDGCEIIDMAVVPGSVFLNDGIFSITQWR